jgi:Activator of Hsp90 ATPase homolog 1-like protein
MTLQEQKIVQDDRIRGTPETGCQGMYSCAACLDGQRMPSCRCSCPHRSLPASAPAGSAVGGRYELTMVQRDGGGEFAIGYEIVELVEPELIVLRSDPMPEVGTHDPTITRVEFHDHGAKTRMTAQRRALPRWPRPRRGGVDRRLR